MKNRIYISGAISGTDDYMERFAKAQKELESQGYSVINPALINSNMPEDTTYEEYMKMSFTMLDMADSIYMLRGWEKSCGANREYRYALAMDKVIIFERGVRNLTYKKIREIAGQAIKKGKIDDYRPACGLYVDGMDDIEQIPNAIVCWLENGDKIIYIAKERDENETD